MNEFTNWQSDFIGGTAGNSNFCITRTSFPVPKDSSQVDFTVLHFESWFQYYLHFQYTTEYSGRVPKASNSGHKYTSVCTIEDWRINQRSETGYNIFLSLLFLRKIAPTFSFSLANAVATVSLSCISASLQRLLYIFFICKSEAEFEKRRLDDYLSRWRNFTKREKWIQTSIAFP